MPAPATPGTEGQLVEVFSSLQGEGVLVGWRQIFVRLPGCNLDCNYCDTSVDAPVKCQVESRPGSGQVRLISNPVSLETLRSTLDDWTRNSPHLYHSISITGGEPLLHEALLRDWLPSLRNLLPICLETNGTLPAALPSLLEHVDFISMDIKPPSATGGESFWAEHQEFLSLAAAKEGQVKVVVAEDTTDEELDVAARLVARSAAGWPLVLQPITVDGRPGVSGLRLLELQERLSALHGIVRVIPQTHPWLDIF